MSLGFKQQILALKGEEEENQPHPETCRVKEAEWMQHRRKCTYTLVWNSPACCDKAYGTVFCTPMRTWLVLLERERFRQSKPRLRRRPGPEQSQKNWPTGRQGSTGFSQSGFRFLICLSCLLDSHFKFADFHIENVGSLRSSQVIILICACQAEEHFCLANPVLTSTGVSLSAA